MSRAHVVQAKNINIVMVRLLNRNDDVRKRTLGFVFLWLLYAINLQSMSVLDRHLNTKSYSSCEDNEFFWQVIIRLL